jgi:SAM-dependent methyltransferase
MIHRILSVYKAAGASGVWSAILWRLNLAGPRKISLRLLAARSGIEIGGPSSVFSKSGPLPIYPIVGTLDNCNFSAATVWQPNALAGEEAFQFDTERKAGYQFISEASNLSCISTSAYDFLICSHVIEHVANPLRALREWLRVVRPGGTLLVVAPHRQGAFDHRRPVTTFQHLVEDFERGTKEDDLTHLPEILALHDLSRDPDAGTHAQFEARSRKNLENRCLHHHVFDVELVGKMLTHAECEILALDQLAPHHIIAVARKSL